MWSEIFSLVKNVLVLNEQTQQNKENIKDLQRSVKELDETVRHLSTLVALLAQDNLRLRDEIKNAREQEASEREKLALRLENEMLRFERRLPSGETKKKINSFMKKVVLLFSLIVLFSVAASAQISIPLPQKKSEKQMLNPIEADALHNLDVAGQYFIKKRHIGALERSSEAIVAIESGGIQFAKMDALLYYAGMSSYFLATGQGKQKIDLTRLSEENKKKYAPEKLREEAIAYLSTLVEKYPQSKYKDEAAKALKELESPNTATK